jgi:hypothetical protein
MAAGEPSAAAVWLELIVRINRDVVTINRLIWNSGFGACKCFTQFVGPNAMNHWLLVYMGVKGRLLSRAKTPLLVRRALQHSLGIQHEQICFQLFSGMSQLLAPCLPISAFQHFSFQFS